MTNRKQESVSWLDTLNALGRIIRTEYPDGGRLPSAEEMCRRLNVANRTYLKALKAACSHGLAISARGRGGIMIPRPDSVPLKVGFLIGSGGLSPILVFGGRGRSLMVPAFFRSISLRNLTVQMVTRSPGETLRDHLMLFNNRALFCYDPDPELLPELADVLHSGIPVVLCGYLLYETFVRALEYGIPVVTKDLEEEAKRIAEFARSRGFRSLRHVCVSFPNDLSASFERVFSEAGFPFSAGDSITLSALPSGFGRFSETLDRETLLIVEGGLDGIRSLFRSLQELPPERRPSVIFREQRDQRKIRSEAAESGIPAVGILNVDYEAIGVRAADLIASALKGASLPAQTGVACVSISPAPVRRETERKDPVA